MEKVCYGGKIKVLLRNCLKRREVTTRAYTVIVKYGIQQELVLGFLFYLFYIIYSDDTILAHSGKT